ncbi:DegT/DnrJ/EryC1/StrS family aminotransferase [uncultured Trichococcus sp.]|uniref:DegT/DnrJ/EryC1/StrS family aminotransferase n=1 Tax=uncultured Trichococcus sp. TaxID=189665 RepID=UPI0029C657BF|nr:DegT/DnrJ/EryC1/StrS family aminotransferase [uncultured Trichococcus sp.]
MKYSEIGSNFWLDPDSTYSGKPIPVAAFNLPEGDLVYTSTGRSAIALSLRQLDIPDDKKMALLPAYTCDSVVLPFVENGFRVAYYDLEKDLSMDEQAFVEKVSKLNPTVILVHNYFGFDTLSPMKAAFEMLRSQGIFLIEDLTQVLFSAIPRVEADFHVASFRKWMPIPEGGLALRRDGQFRNVPSETDAVLEKAKLDGLHEKFRYIVKSEGQKQVFLDKCRIAEEILETQGEIYAMGDFSKRFLGDLDIAELKQRRRENYRYLLDQLKDSHSLAPVFPELLETVVPLYLPLYAPSEESRNRLQLMLREKAIYAPIVWPNFDGFKGLELKGITESVAWIYTHTLSLPMDQRYALEDMAAIAAVLSAFEKTEAPHTDFRKEALP